MNGTFVIAAIIAALHGAGPAHLFRRPHQREIRAHDTDGDCSPNAAAFSAEPPPEWKGPVRNCLRRVDLWQAPPNWAPVDWREEMTALCAAAACRAVSDYDRLRGVPLGAFLRQRMLTCARTRYRQEWRYALRHVAAAEDGSEECRAESTECPLGLRESIALFLGQLPATDRWLLQQLFWHDRGETTVARSLGISQPAVNKRKQRIFRALRAFLERDRG